MRPVFLIGYMGCGKSTLGRALSKATALQFIDLDTFIETRFRMNVRDIFSQRGADAFRDMERRMLREVGEFEDTVIACGGGTPCFFDNMEFMKSRGTVVRLQASRGRLLDRLVKGSFKRPRLKGKSREEIESIIDADCADREPFYSLAHLTFPSDLLENREEIDYSVGRFIELLRTLPGSGRILPGKQSQNTAS